MARGYPLGRDLGGNAQGGCRAREPLVQSDELQLASPADSDMHRVRRPQSMLELTHKFVREPQILGRQLDTVSNLTPPSVEALKGFARLQL